MLPTTVGAPRFIVAGAGLVADFSRQRVSVATLDLLGQWPMKWIFASRIRDMYEGGIANPTESRQVPSIRRCSAPGAPHADLVLAERSRVLDFAEAVRGGRILGSNGEPF
ncbi:MAG: hypothetical protein IPG49_16940 [Proteobacteria bacterium]|nr:hypothetical protein [Pseudomonadota bacterium]